jgi:hypothetical protein
MMEQKVYESLKELSHVALEKYEAYVDAYGEITIKRMNEIIEDVIVKAYRQGMNDCVEITKTKLTGSR